VILVLRLGQPASLALVLAGLATFGFAAELLMVSIEAVGSENLLAAKAFHRSGKKIQHPLRTHQIKIPSFSRKKILFEEERRDFSQALEENEEHGRRRRPHFQTASFAPFSLRRSHSEALSAIRERKRAADVTLDRVLREIAER